MSASLRDMAQLTIFTEADATALRDRRAALVQEAAAANGPRPTYNDLIVWHLARTLADYPLLNASMVGEEIHCWEEINIGVAVALDSGLIVPVVRAANTKSLADLAGETADLAERARTNRLSPDELLGGTFTITNLGTLDVDGFHAHHQSAAVGHSRRGTDRAAAGCRGWRDRGTVYGDPEPVLRPSHCGRGARRAVPPGTQAGHRAGVITVGSRNYPRPALIPAWLRRGWQETGGRPEERN